MIKEIGLNLLSDYGTSRLCTIHANMKNFKKALPICRMAVKKTVDCDTTVLNNLMFVEYNMGNSKAAQVTASEILACDKGHRGARQLLGL